MKSKLTPTQQKIFDLLADGFPHGTDELRKCLWDEQNESPDTAVRKHISDIRKAIDTQGLTIISAGKNGQFKYRLVRFVSAGE